MKNEQQLQAMQEMEQFISTTTPAEMEQSLWDMFMSVIENQGNLEQVKDAAHTYRSLSVHLHRVNALLTN